MSRLSGGLAVAVDPSLPFSAQTYRARCQAVCDVMAERGLDLLYITSPANLQYRTGYHANWYPSRLPLGVLIERSTAGMTLFDWSRHQAYASTRVLCDALYLMDYGTAPQTVAQVIAERGWARASIGIEWSSPTPVAQITNALAEALQTGGAHIRSGDWIVDTVRLYKSTEELALLRRASAIADAALAAIIQEVAIGKTPIALSARLTELLVEGGSGYAAMPPLVSAGPTAAFDVHAHPSARPLEHGDVVGIDCCATLEGYHVNLARSVLIGGGEHPARGWLEAGEHAVAALKAAALPSQGTEFAAAAAERRIRDAVPEENIWWIGGYSLGIATSPSWVGHTYLANDGPERCIWADGFVSNFETIFLDPVEGYAAEAIDTVAMIDGRLEVLSSLPRTLINLP
ncbi:MAG TPA: M24 family metallopeptidase, partial [Burkholderiales bacterium]